MSTFVGVVKEIPFIAVDYFDNARDPTPKIYFLSHFHTDHTKGLDNQHFQEDLLKSKAYIYASPITISYIQLKFPRITPKLQELEVGKHTFIKYDEEGEEKLLQVTPIPAGHCPGSVMFFFENDLNILCTGDFRLSANELTKIKCFKTDSNQTKKIHTVYLDSTFLSEEYTYFPSIQQSADALCDLIKDWLDQNSAATVWITQSANYGPEYLLIEISKRLGEKIHVPNDKFLYQCIPELDNVLSTKSDNYKYKIHAFRGKSCCHQPDFLALHIRVSAMLWIGYKPGEYPVRHKGNNAMVCASFHASCREIEEFLDYLKPDNVTLCVESKDYNERKKMLDSLTKMMNKYKLSKEESEPIIIKKIRCDKFPKRTKSSNDLLSSPPREFKAKRL